MELPIEEARLIQQILTEFAIRLKTVEIAVARSAPSGSWDFAQKTAAELFATPHISEPLPVVEYGSLQAALRGIYASLKTTP